MEVNKQPSNAELRSAFTLIELLVVITVIVILIGLLFPAFRGVQDQAKRTQAKNDVTQIVTAVNAYYTEYGKYPIDPNLTAGDKYYGSGTVPTGSVSAGTTDKLFDVLRNKAENSTNAPLLTTLNPRGVAFISPSDAKSPAAPKSGIGIAGTGAPTPLGQFYDPWGNPYSVLLDGSYDNQVPNPYSSNAGATPNLQVGVIAWSLGKDGLGGSGDKKSTNSDDDVISWQ